MGNEMANIDRVNFLQGAAVSLLEIKPEEARYFVFTDSIQNRAYNAGVGNIKILMKNNAIVDIAKASDLSNLESLQKTVEKYILCYPRGI
jgi:hypothetical protein